MKSFQRLAWCFGTFLGCSGTFLGCAETSVDALADANVIQRPDAAEDAGVPSDAAPANDASSPSDATANPDTGLPDSGLPDDSLEGSALKGIELIWPERLELCSIWRENRSIEDERADQASITFFQAARPSLGRSDLESARLPRGYLRLGTTGAEQFPLDPATITSSLIRWDLTNTRTDSRLSAAVEHDLGAIGTLTEEFNIYRGFGDTRPIEVGGGYYEHSFVLLRPDSREVVFLGSCAGPKDLDDAFQVLTTSDGSRDLTMLRKLRTTEAAAGSAPVYLKTAEIRLSGDPQSPYRVHGFFGQTYAAKHHNWDEDSVIDLKADPAYYHFNYKSYLDGTGPFLETISEIRMRGLNSFGQPQSLDVDFITMGTLRTDNFPTRANWVRVDDTYLMRGQLQSCPSVRTAAVSDNNYTFQLVMCPRMADPGFELLGVMPVFFAAEPSQAGVYVDERAIEEFTSNGMPAFRMPIGSTTVVIVPQGGSHEVSISDQLGKNLNLFRALEQPLDIGSTTSHIAAKTETEDVILRFGRATVRENPIGFSLDYAPVYFELTFGGKTYVVDALDRLDYQSSHHNWNDAFEAKTEGLTLRWSDPFMDGDPTDCLVRVVRDSDGVELLPETRLIYETER